MSGVRLAPPRGKSGRVAPASGFDRYLADARAAFPGEVARAHAGAVFTV